MWRSPTRSIFDGWPRRRACPTTSQPTPQDFLAHFEQVRDAGDSLVCVLLASKLSGTFQSAQLAKELSGYDEIYIVDSQQALCGLRMLVDFACVLRG